LIKYLSLMFKIHIHPLFWIVAALSIVTAQFKQLILLFIIVFFHEMGHALCARFFSWRIKNIILFPFGGVVEVEEYGNRPYKEELLVILSGPLQHVWLQGAAFLLLYFGIFESATYQLFTIFNITILLFNLVPIWPLDGGKLLFLCFSIFKSFPVAHRLTIICSVIFIILLAIISLIILPYHLNLWLIITFLLYSIYQEYKQRSFAYMRFLIERYYGKKQEFLVLRPITVDQDEPIYEVLLKFQRGCKHPVIVEKDGKKVFQFDENELLHAYFSDKRLNAKVGDLMYVY